MNIKVVYKKRIHKLAANIQTIEQIKAYMKNIYKEKMGSNIKLHIQIDPISQQLLVIENDDQLMIAYQIYKKNDWNSLKILVQDNEDDINQQDMDLLNQSMIQNRSQYQIQQKQVDQLPVEDPKYFETSSQQTEQKQFTDVQISNHPEQNDQTQQTKIVENDTVGVQAIVSTNEKGQNPDMSIQEIANQLGIQDKDSEILEKVLKLIDMRLLHFGLIKPEQIRPNEQQEKLEQKEQVSDIISQTIINEQPKFYSPEMFLESVCKIQYEVKIGQLITQTIQVRNKGKQQWPADVCLVCLEGQFQGIVAQLDRLQSNASQTIDIQLKPSKLCKNEQQVFKLAYNDGEKLIQFGQKIEFQLTVSDEQVPNQFEESISCKNIDKSQILKQTQEVLKKAKQLKELFPQLQLKELITFINQTGTALTIDELIEGLCNQNF